MQTAVKFLTNSQPFKIFKIQKLSKSDLILHILQQTAQKSRYFSKS
jgi:hypothetical protein